MKKQQPPLLGFEEPNGDGRKRHVNEFKRGKNRPGSLFFAMPDPATHTAFLSTDFAATFPTAATGHTNSLVPNEQSNNVRNSVPVILAWSGIEPKYNPGRCFAQGAQSGDSSRRIARR